MNTSRIIAIAASAVAAMACAGYASERAKASAALECSSRGMEAYLADDTDGALAWLGEANRAAAMGDCRDNMSADRVVSAD